LNTGSYVPPLNDTGVTEPNTRCNKNGHNNLLLPLKALVMNV
jgi:hypothetical protein